MCMCVRVYIESEKIFPLFPPNDDFPHNKAKNQGEKWGKNRILGEKFFPLAVFLKHLPGIFPSFHEVTE